MSRTEIWEALQTYRSRVLRESQYVDLRGLPEPVGRDGRRFSLHMPLDRVYIRLQAIEEAQARRSEEEEAQRLAEEVRAGEPHPTPARPPGFLDRLLGRAAPAEKARPTARLSPLSVLRTLGEYLYRRGETYAAAQCPDPVDPEAALQKHNRLVILGAPGAGKSTLLRYLARQAARDPDGPIPILVPLGEYAAALSLGQATSLRDFALARAAAGDPTLHAALAEVVARGRALWLVDVLDEAREFRARAAREAAALPGQLVLTSRAVGYERPPIWPICPTTKSCPWKFKSSRTSCSAGSPCWPSAGKRMRSGCRNGWTG